MREAYMKVNEVYTTQTCSSCGCISDSNPKGMGSLGIREWTCLECGTQHDRDINAAKNYRYRTSYARRENAIEITTIQEPQMWMGKIIRNRETRCVTGEDVV